MKKIKKIKYFLEYIIVYIISLILNILPINFSSYIGGFIFKIFGPLTKTHFIAKNNYLKIFPLAKHKEVKKNILLSWENLGRTFFELLILPKLIKLSKKYIKIEGLDNLKNLNTKNERFMFITIHQSNWEIVVPIIDKLKFRVGAIYRHINNPYLNNFILKKRSNSLNNIKSFYTPKGKKSAVDIIKAIKNNSSVLVVVDQKDSAGINIPFFGNDVKTQTGFLKIAKKYNMKIIPIENTRTSTNILNLKFHQPIKFPKNVSNSFEQMKYIHLIIEGWIKNNPSNWFFQHNRFN